MPIVAPDVYEFKDRYPAFASAPDAAVYGALDESTAMVDENWLARDIAPAIMAHAAHLLTVEGHGAAASVGGSSIQLAGPVDSVQVGDVRTTFAQGVTRAKVALKGDDSGLKETAFGRRYLELRRRNAVAAIALND